MSAFLRLNTQDAFVAPYTAHKLYNFESSQELLDEGIDRYYVDDITTGLRGDISSYNNTAVYNTVKHLYYSTFTDNEVYEGGYDHYVPTSLTPNRTLGTEFVLITIPKSIYGEAIKPGSLEIEESGDVITDNGEGVLYFDGNVVGNIIYSHGMIIITDESTFTNTTFSGLDAGNISLTFRNSYTLFEHQYRCRVNQSQLNFTQNPSSHDEGELASNLTGSYFQPYITTVGLYNDANELVAVGKLNIPIPKSQYNDMTFVVKFDA